jgi:UDP-N-acetylglucosamine--dolichyl-phosphate N-acetylglucosaminephosphotransferase
MTLADTLGLALGFREAIAAGLLVGLAGALVATPRTMRKLEGADITGRDMHKKDEPEIPEMGGLAVFLAFNVGAFTVLGFGDVPRADEVLVLAGLVTGAGGLITGVLDDLIVLRQRFKAFIPFAFAAPLGLYVNDFVVQFPLFGGVDFSWVYPLVLVPLGIATASNGLNMLEGFNGLGAGLGVILAAAISVLCLLQGKLAALALTFPLIGALGGFLWFNVYPSRVFPGDTMTLFVGAILGAAIIVGKIELWGGLLLIPHVVEFVLKLVGGFEHETFATGRTGDRLHYVGPVRSLTHLAMKHLRVSEPRLVLTFWAGELAWAGLVVVGYLVDSGRFLASVGF